jgi:hypothetical protein
VGTEKLVDGAATRSRASSPRQRDPRGTRSLPDLLFGPRIPAICHRSPQTLIVFASKLVAIFKYFFDLSLFVPAGDVSKLMPNPVLPTSEPSSTTAGILKRQESPSSNSCRRDSPFWLIFRLAIFLAFALFFCLALYCVGAASARRGGSTASNSCLVTADESIFEFKWPDAPTLASKTSCESLLTHDCAFGSFFYDGISGSGFASHRPACSRSSARRSELPIIRLNVDFKSMYPAFFVWFSLVSVAKIAKGWKRYSFLQRTVIKYVHIFHHMIFIVRSNSALTIRFLIHSCRLRQIRDLRTFLSSFLAPCALKLKNMQNWMASAVLVVIVFTAPVGVQGIPYVRIPQTRYDLLQSFHHLNRRRIHALF